MTNWLLVILASASAGAGTLVAQDTPTPAAVSPADFAALSWLEGRWVGSGGGYDAFYEAYRFVDEHTLEQTTYPDGTFAEADGRSTIELRGAHILKFRNGQQQSFVARLAADSLRFEWSETGRPGFTWIRVSDEEWRAVLDRGEDREPVVYIMRRLEGGGAGR